MSALPVLLSRRIKEGIHMKNPKWIVLLAVALSLGTGTALADPPDQHQDASTQMKHKPAAATSKDDTSASATSTTSGNEVVGTITAVDGMVYTINDFRGKSHELELADKNVQWGGPTQIGSRVKARVEGNQITELVNLEE